MDHKFSLEGEISLYFPMGQQNNPKNTKGFIISLAFKQTNKKASSTKNTNQNNYTNFFMKQVTTVFSKNILPGHILPHITIFHF